MVLDDEKFQVSEDPGPRTLSDLGDLPGVTIRFELVKLYVALHIDERTVDRMQLSQKRRGEGASA